MPVTVPKEPKKYTTVYDNFKGVDYTNDASNVYKRRSPSGKNMIPDLDGRPRKRRGWDVKFSKDDFIQASGATGVTSVMPIRTHYFSYGGHDFIMVFNTLGVFYIRDDSTIPVLCQLATWVDESLDIYTTGRFPPDPADPETKESPDANRAFFFEGQGKSGFYTFVGKDLYRFQSMPDDEMRFVLVEPKVPVVIIGADPTTCAGTNYESVNMLTDKRTIEYFGDARKSEYKISPKKSTQDPEVSMLNLDTGDWETIPKTHATYPWEVTADGIRFTGTAPPTSTVGNVRITYIPEQTPTYSSVKTQTRPATAIISVKTEYVKNQIVKEWREFDPATGKTRVRKEYIPKNPQYSASGTAQVTGGRVVLPVPGIVRPDLLEITTDPPALARDVNPGAYTDLIEVVIDDEAATEGTPTETDEVEGIWRSAGVEIHIDGYVTCKTTRFKRNKTVIQRFVVDVTGTYYKLKVDETARDAFTQCRKVLNFGNDVYNHVFISSSTARNYRNRVWYCAANDPSYFPDTNYIEVGSDDKAVMGLQKVGSYLGIIKMGSGTEASVYLAYPTSFEENNTYAVKQGISGIGAIATGAFNILNEEPLFLSERGVMGINVSEPNTDKQIRNRSFFINKRLLAESNIENAVSFVHDGMYFLAVNDRCYVLDGSQKSSWVNEKTNLQYECYYLENIPAQCFAKIGYDLYFSDYKGNLCCFRDKSDPLAYVDKYSVNGARWVATSPPDQGKYDIKQLFGGGDEESYLTDADSNYLVGDYDSVTSGRLLVMSGLADDNETISYNGQFYTITSIDDNGIATVSEGVPIEAEWSTIADDDGMVHFFKNLAKKGCVVSLLPNERSTVDVLIKPDEKDAILVVTATSEVTTLPYDVIVKKKIKKYKRLQFICRNNRYNNGFALDQIIKTYTVGNYSKNRG